MVNADAQDLGIRSGVLGLGGFERLDLVRSNRCPGQREERQHNVFPTQLAQVNLTAEVGWEREGRGWFSDLKRHGTFSRVQAKEEAWKAIVRLYRKYPAFTGRGAPRAGRSRW